MYAATKRWLRKNRTPVAIGVGLVGAGYVATKFIVSKLNDARERLSSDRIAKDNLRRRFEQNQADATFTVLALLPTATARILEVLPTEQITLEIQKVKATPSRAPPSIADTTMTAEDEVKSCATLHLGNGSVAGAGEAATASSATDTSGPSGEATPTTTTAGSISGAHGPAHSEGPTSTSSTPLPTVNPAPSPKPKKTKRQLWDELTISSITRSFTLVYTLALLTIFTRIQLNLLGRRSYLSSVVTLATISNKNTISLQNNDDIEYDQVYGSDYETNRKYLTFSWWLLNKGWVDIMHRVEAAVRQVFGPLSPRESLTYEQFSVLAIRVRQIVEGADPEQRQARKWLPFLLPEPEKYDYVIRESGVMKTSFEGTPEDDEGLALPPNTEHAWDHQHAEMSLHRLLAETADLVDSPAFSQVLTLLLDAGFAHLVENKVATGVYGLPPVDVRLTQGIFSDAAQPSPAAPSSSQQLQLQNEPYQPINQAVLLPKILSLLTRQAHVIGNGMPNEYLEEMERVRDLEAFSAVVYSSNWEAEINEESAFIEEQEEASQNRQRQLQLWGHDTKHAHSSSSPSSPSSPVSFSSSGQVHDFTSSRSRPQRRSSFDYGDDSLIFVEKEHSPLAVPGSDSGTSTNSANRDFEDAWAKATGQ